MSRMENEELLDRLRERMHTEAAKKLYKLRSQTVELSFADMKEHRDLRRFHSRGLRLVNMEVGCLVLVNNALYVETQCGHKQCEGSANTEMPQTLYVA